MSTFTLQGQRYCGSQNHKRKGTETLPSPCLRPVIDPLWCRTERVNDFLRRVDQKLGAFCINGRYLHRDFLLELFQFVDRQVDTLVSCSRLRLSQGCDQP